MSSRAKPPCINLLPLSFPNSVVVISFPSTIVALSDWKSSLNFSVYYLIKRGCSPRSAFAAKRFVLEYSICCPTFSSPIPIFTSEAFPDSVKLCAIPLTPLITMLSAMTLPFPRFLSKPFSRPLLTNRLMSRFPFYFTSVRPQTRSLGCHHPPFFPCTPSPFAIKVLFPSPLPL